MRNTYEGRTDMTIHRVTAKETVSLVARRHGILPTTLAALNGLTEKTPLVEGQALLISLPGRTYHVREGDTLKKIAERHGLSLSALLRQNPPLCRGEEIYEGMTLTLSSATPPRTSLVVTGVAAAETGEADLLPSLPYLTFLALLSCRLGPHGELTPPNDKEAVAAARAGGAVPLLGLSFAGGTAAEEEATAREFYGSEAASRAAAEALLPLLSERGYGGVFLDLPFVPEECSTAHRAFVMSLRRRLGHASTVMVSAPPPTAPSDALSSLGRAAGALSLETYDFATRYGTAAPDAPYDRVEAAVRAAVGSVRPQKLSLGISTRATDFPVGGGAGRVFPAAETTRLAAERGCAIAYDPVAHLSYLSYEENGCRRIAFFEDVGTVYEKLALAERYGLCGITLYPAVGLSPAITSALAAAGRIVRAHGG